VATIWKNLTEEQKNIINARRKEIYKKDKDIILEARKQHYAEITVPKSFETWNSLSEQEQMFQFFNKETAEVTEIINQMNNTLPIYGGIRSLIL